MDGIHDLGGKQGFGSVEVEKDEPAFHARWEAKILAIQRYSHKIKAWKNLDQFRHAVERIDPVAYLTHSYYGRWLGGIETLCVEAGVLSQEEISKRVETMGGDPTEGIAARPSSSPAPLGPDPEDQGMVRNLDSNPKYVIGQSVITKMLYSNGHTRLPQYARGKEGVVVKINGGWVYPDTNAAGQGEQSQALYTVAFSGQELWGPDAEDDITVNLDLFENYLESSPSKKE